MSQGSVWLGPCLSCGNRFLVDLDWWWERQFTEGMPALEECRSCAASLHHDAPVPPPPPSWLAA